MITVFRKAAACAAAALFAAASCGGAKDKPYDHYLIKKTTVADGEKREYWVHPPVSYDAARSWPLVLALHGGGGAADKMNKLTGFNALADREGFIVVYPQGLGKHWNDGRTVNARATSDVDDVSFLVALAGELGGEYNVDPNRVYACGISNGAMMSFRLGADRPDVFAAVAGVAGAVTKDLALGHPLRAPIPCLFINGTEDPLVPYGGGDIEIFGFKRGAVLSTPASVAWWLEGNGAENATATVAEYPDAAGADGCRAVREDYGGPGGADVALVRVEGGGHTWPGGWQYLSERIVGKTCRDVDGSEIIWAFFAAHPKP